MELNWQSVFERREMFILGRWWRMKKKKRGFFLLVCKCEKFLLFFLSQVFFCFAGSPTPEDSP
jgi:hypothetical protein